MFRTKSASTRSINTSERSWFDPSVLTPTVVDYAKSLDVDKYADEEGAKRLLSMYKDLEKAKDVIYGEVWLEAYNTNELIDFAQKHKLLQYENTQVVINLHIENKRSYQKTLAELQRVLRQERAVRFEAKYSEFLSYVRIQHPGYNGKTYFCTESIESLEERLNATGKDGFVTFETCEMKKDDVVKKSKMTVRNSSFVEMFTFDVHTHISR